MKINFDYPNYLVDEAEVTVQNNFTGMHLKRRRFDIICANPNFVNSI